MAKRIFTIAPKLTDEPHAKPEPLPVQNFSVEQIEKLANAENSSPIYKDAEKKPRAAARKGAEKANPKPQRKNPKSEIRNPQSPMRPQGRPPRQIEVRRISSDLPVEIYDRLQQEIREGGYTLNGLLARALREFFDRKTG